MEIYRKMFAEKILSFHEGTNRILKLLMGLPVIGHHVSSKIFNRKNSKLRTVIGFAAMFVRSVWQFIKKYLYVAFLMYFPYRFMAHFCPLIASNQESAMLFMFFVLSSVCGSFANNTLFAMGDRDYLMVKVVLVSPYMNFLGRLAVKMITDLIYFTIILCMFDVSFANSLLVSIVTVCIRPVGEMFALVGFENIRSMYNSRNLFNGTVIAVCILLAYGLPLLERRISSGWLIFVNPVFVVVTLFIGVFAVYYCWSYPHYRKIMREAVHIKREI